LLHNYKLQIIVIIIIIVALRAEIADLPHKTCHSGVALACVWVVYRRPDCRSVVLWVRIRSHQDLL